MTDQYNVLDLFSGTGGLTEGFSRTGRFRMISHIEMNAHATTTLKTRMLYYALKDAGHGDIYRKYMTEFGQKGARESFVRACSNAGISEADTGVVCATMSEFNRGDLKKEVGARLDANNTKEIDLIIGGPPCQAYSTIRRWHQNHDPCQSDPRLYLYNEYQHYLRTFRPRFFVFENVPGLQSIGSGKYLENIRRSMKEAGYQISMNILDAADFNVIQHRRRIIFIGWRKDEKPDEPVFPTPGPQYTIHDLIMEDLPVLDAGDGSICMEYRAGPNEYLKKSGIRPEGQNILLHHIARPHCDRDIEIYKLAILAMNEGKRIKYTDLPESLQTHKNVTSFLDRFKVVREDDLCHALVAHIHKDGHYYIHPDLQHPRSLSVREAARVQSFPDDYIFEGSRGAQFTQIGNAVPPLMAEGIARKILEMAG